MNCEKNYYHAYLKRLLLIFSTLLFLLQSAYALQCTIDATERSSYGSGNSYTYEFGSNRYCSVQIDIKRQTGGTNGVKAEYSENGTWVKAAEWDAGDLSAGSYVTKYLLYLLMQQQLR